MHANQEQERELFAQIQFANTIAQQIHRASWLPFRKHCFRVQKYFQYLNFIVIVHFMHLKYMTNKTKKIILINFSYIIQHIMFDNLQTIVRQRMRIVALTILYVLV